MIFLIKIDFKKVNLQGCICVKCSSSSVWTSDSHFWRFSILDIFCNKETRLYSCRNWKFVINIQLHLVIILLHILEAITRFCWIGCTYELAKITRFVDRSQLALCISISKEKRKKMKKRKKNRNKLWLSRRHSNYNSQWAYFLG